MPPPVTQIFPPCPSFTENHIPDLTGKVIIVTGSTSGVGFQTATILYSKSATVYIAARNAENAKRAIADIKGSAECAQSRGHLVFLPLDLSNLAGIKASAEEFLAKEERLDVLIHNAGVMTPPAGSKTAQGHDLEMGTNCLGPFLFNQLLLPLLQRTAATAPADSVRVVWLSSMVSIRVPQGGIILDDESGTPKVLKNAMENYMQSKVGNVFLASELAGRARDTGILSLSVHPGLMKTELQRHGPAIQGKIMDVLFKPPRYGAYTELFAALSSQVTSEHNGAFIIPWGRLGPIPSHIERALRPVDRGGTGTAERFWDWCERETGIFR